MGVGGRRVEKEGIKVRGSHLQVAVGKRVDATQARGPSYLQLCGLSGNHMEMVRPLGEHCGQMREGGFLGTFPRSSPHSLCLL